MSYCIISLSLLFFFVEDCAVLSFITCRHYKVIHSTCYVTNVGAFQKKSAAVDKLKLGRINEFNF